MSKDIKEIHLGDNTIRPSAWILLGIFGFGAINFLLKKNTTFFYISLLIGIALFAMLMLFPDKPPRKVSIDPSSKLITIHNYCPKKNILLKIDELSKIDWEINWHAYPAIVYITFYNRQGEDVYSFPGYVANHKRTAEKSIDNLSSKHEDLINFIANCIQENQHTRSDFEQI